MLCFLEFGSSCFVCMVYGLRAGGVVLQFVFCLRGCCGCRICFLVEHGLRSFMVGGFGCRVFLCVHSFRVTLYQACVFKAESMGAS